MSLFDGLAKMFGGGGGLQPSELVQGLPAGDPHQAAALAAGQQPDGPSLLQKLQQMGALGAKGDGDDLKPSPDLTAPMQAGAAQSILSRLGQQGGGGGRYVPFQPGQRYL